MSLVIAALVSGVCRAGKDNPVSPESLIAQARKIQEVWTAGTPPLNMRTEIQVFYGKDKVTPGQYVVTWLSSSRWREELEIQGYKRLRVHNAQGYWQQSSATFQPELVFQLDPLWDLKTVLKVKAKEALGKVRSRDKDGVRENCIEIKRETGTDRVLCFDEAHGNLLSVEYPRSENQNPPAISRIEYSAFNMVGDKRIPFEVRAFRDRTVVATAKVLDVTPATEVNSALFATPTNSEFWPQCDDMQDPELVGRVQPEYPATARSNGEQGRVVFYAVIESDGTLSHLTLIQRATPALQSAAAQAIRRWRYKPAACGSTPIRLETSLPVDFWLQH
jgi:TonB family protein